MESDLKWKHKFIFLVAYLIGYYLGGMSEKTDRWFYLGPNGAKADSAFISIYTGD